MIAFPCSLGKHIQVIATSKAFCWYGIDFKNNLNVKISQNWENICKIRNSIFGVLEVLKSVMVHVIIFYYTNHIEGSINVWEFGWIYFFKERQIKVKWLGQGHPTT